MARPTHQVDFAVLGGGVSAVLAVHQLWSRTPRPSVVWFCGAGGLADAQTGHAHAMLHRGHYQIGKFKVPQTWLATLSPTSRSRIDAATRAPTMATLLTLGADAWRRAGVPVAGRQAVYLDETKYGSTSHLRTMEPVPTVRGTRYDRWLVDEDWIDPRVVVAHLIASIGECCVYDDASLVVDGSGDVAVVASGIEVRARNVLVACGRSNAQLLEGIRDLGGEAHMVPVNELVVEGPGRDGPALSLVAPDGTMTRTTGGGVRWYDPLTAKVRAGLLSSHPFPSSTENAWLFTDGLHDTDHPRWLRTVLPAILCRTRELDLGVVPTRLRWSVAQRDAHEWRIDSDKQVGYWTVVERRMGARVAAVWPTKFTLAPLAVEDALGRLESVPTKPSTPLSTLAPPPPIAPRPWASALVEWPEFVRTHGLDEAALMAASQRLG